LALRSFNREFLRPGCSVCSLSALIMWFQLQQAAVFKGKALKCHCTPKMHVRNELMSTTKHLAAKGARYFPWELQMIDRVDLYRPHVEICDFLTNLRRVNVLIIISVLLWVSPAQMEVKSFCLCAHAEQQHSSSHCSCSGELRHINMIQNLSLTAWRASCVWAPLYINRFTLYLVPGISVHDGWAPEL